MFYRFEGNPLFSEYYINDHVIRYGTTSYPLAELTSIGILYTPSVGKAGVVEAVFGAKKILLAYNFKEIPKMKLALPALQDIARTNSGAPKKFRSKAGMEKGKELYEACDAKIRVMFKEVSGTDFEVIVDELNQGEPVILSFIANMKSKTNKIDSAFAMVMTDERLILGQKKAYAQSIYSIWFDELDKISYHESEISGLLTIFTENDRWNMKVESLVIARRLNAVLEEETAKNFE